MSESESSAGGSSDATLGDDPGASTEVGRPLARGDLVGRYVIASAIGHGGMGVVYAAHDPELDRRLAIKVLHPHARGSIGSSSGQERMLREARAMARLNHRNVVVVHDVGPYEGSVYVAMEFIDGITLSQWLTAETRTWSEIVAVFAQAGEGLAAAHEAGLVHRDFKPENVMIAGGPRGSLRVVVMDFGLARTAADVDLMPTQAERILDPDAPTALDSGLTQTGALLGTPAYMAPEQHLQRRTTAQTDQFSFCVALHEALFGVRPFPGATAPELALTVTRGERQDPVDLRGVPARVHRALVRGLATEPAARWPSMRALVAELERDPSRRWRRIAAITAVPALAVAGAVMLDRLDDARDESICAGGDAQVAEVWNDERRTAIATAFAGTSLGHADETRARVEHALDGWVVAWPAAYREACEATSLAHVQSEDLLDRRMSCLRGRLADVDALLGQLEEITPRLVDRATWAVSSAVDLSMCADVDVLVANVPLPEDTAMRTYVDLLRVDVAVAQAQRTAGRSADARVSLESVLARLDQEDWPPLRAHVLFILAQVLDELGDPKVAEATMTEAYWTARKSGADRVAAQTASQLMSMKSLSHPDEVDLWEQQARADLDRLGDQSEDRARFLDTLAEIALNAHELDRAEALHLEALPIWERLYGPESLDVAVVEHGLGNVAFLRKDDEMAIAHYGHAIEIWRAQLGEHHPRLADGYNALGNVAHRAGRLDDAEREYTAGLRVIEAAYGDSHIGLAGPLNGLALVEDARGNFDRAFELHERFLAIATATYGERHPTVAIALSNGGDALIELGRVTEGIERHRRALAIREETLGRAHPVTGMSLDDLGHALAQQGRFTEAIPLFERGLEIAIENQAPPAEIDDLRNALAEARAAREKRPN